MWFSYVSSTGTFFLDLDLPPSPQPKVAVVDPIFLFHLHVLSFHVLMVALVVPGCGDHALSQDSKKVAIRNTAHVGAKRKKHMKRNICELNGRANR